LADLTALTGEALAAVAASATLAALEDVRVRFLGKKGAFTEQLKALGVGPVGAAFYAWDIGMKRGDIRVLGAASYATPLLSTMFLILAGFAKASTNLALAAVLIAGGGLIAAKDMVLRK
jgi:drug/metabolite transporter (DMT)-like permease